MSNDTIPQMLRDSIHLLAAWVDAGLITETEAELRLPVWLMAVRGMTFSRARELAGAPQRAVEKSERAAS